MTTKYLEQGGYGTVSPVGLQLGSVEGNQKGSERMSLGTNKLIGSHIVAAGVVALNGTTSTTVIVPLVSDAVVTASTTTITNYVVLLQGLSAAVVGYSPYPTLIANASAGAAGSTTGQFDSFTITTTGTAGNVNWILVRL